MLCSQMIDFSGITGQSNSNTFSPPGRIIPVQLLASFVSFFWNFLWPYEVSRSMTHKNVCGIFQV